MSKSILIVGHGYFGGHLSDCLSDDTFQLFVTTRNSRNKASLCQENVSVIQFDVLDGQASSFNHHFDAVVYCVGFDPNQNETRESVYVGGLRNFLTKISTPPKRFVYVSSTGVYGQQAGELVDEESETKPTREGGKACLAAEELLQKSNWECDTTILRFAGIYGPHRIPNRSKLEQGSLSMNASGYLNLIHVKDAAKIAKHFIDRPVEPGRTQVFNVSDGNPISRGNFYSKLAELIGLPQPEIESASGDGTQRRDGSKRISNEKLVRETHYQFLYPSFVEGLEASVQV